MIDRYSWTGADQSSEIAAPRVEHAEPGVAAPVPVRSCVLSEDQQRRRSAVRAAHGGDDNAGIQDFTSPRAIKRRCASMAGFKSFDNAVITIAGIELAHRIHKRQFSFGVGRPRRERSSKVLWDRALA